MEANRPPYGMSDEEFLEIARKLLSNEGSEEQDAEWIDILDDAAPGFVNLLYHDTRDLSPEAALDEIRAKKPIPLGSGTS